MTTSQAETKTATIWDIASDLEGTHVHLHQIRNMLIIYDEHLESDLDFLKNNNKTAAHFVDRYDLLRSMMEVMQSGLNSAVNEMEAQINALYDADRKARPRPLATE